MDIAGLLVFYQVVRCGSFAQAARHLNKPVSTVSRKVQMLEESLNMRLLHRTTRSIQLTDEGHAVWLEAEKMQQTADSVQAIALKQADVAQGTIKLTAPQSFVNWPLSDWLIEFKQRYPLVDIELLVGNRYLDLQQERIDFAFRQGPLTDSNLIAQKIIDVKYGLFATQAVLAKQAPNALTELDNFPCIGVNSGGFKLPWYLSDNGKQIKYIANAGFSVEDNDLVFKATCSGLGIGFLPIFKVEKTLLAEPLLPVLAAHWPDPVPLFLVYPSKQYLPEKNRVFIDFMKDKFTWLQQYSES